jgi:hypothetical protein
MYFWVTLRDSKFHSPNVARSNRASLRCSIDPLPDRHERGVELREPKPYGATVAWLENLGSRNGFFSAVTFGETRAKSTIPDRHAGLRKPGQTPPATARSTARRLDEGRQKYPAFDALHGNLQERIIRV